MNYRIMEDTRQSGRKIYRVEYLDYTVYGQSQQSWHWAASFDTLKEARYFIDDRITASNVVVYGPTEEQQ